MSRITNEELLEMDARVLVPGSPENQINASNAHKIRAEIIVEAANGPVAADADGILQERGITVVPDILANAGGVVVSYFEWVQNIQSVSWTEEEVNEKLKDIMDPAFEVWDIARDRMPHCIGAYLIAVKRVVEAKVAGQSGHKANHRKNHRISKSSSYTKTRHWGCLGSLLYIRGIKCVKGEGPFVFTTIYLLCFLAYRTHYNTGILQKPLSEDKKYCNCTSCVRIGLNAPAGGATGTGTAGDSRCFLGGGPCTRKKVLRRRGWYTPYAQR